MIGKTLNNSEITSQLDRGRMGEVYQAIDTKISGNVAMKILFEKFAGDSDLQCFYQPCMRPDGITIFRTIPRSIAFRQNY